MHDTGTERVVKGLRWTPAGGGGRMIFDTVSFIFFSFLRRARHAPD